MRIVSGLVKHNEDIEDHNLPKMIWFGFEPIAKTDLNRALQVGAASKIPLIAKYTARRAVDAGALEQLVKMLDKKPATLGLLLEGMIDGMEGRVDLKAPASWANVLVTLKKREEKPGS